VELGGEAEGAVVAEDKEHACMLRIAAQPRNDAALASKPGILFKAKRRELPKHVFMKGTGLSDCLSVHAMIAVKATFVLNTA